MMKNRMRLFLIPVLALAIAMMRTPEAVAQEPRITANVDTQVTEPLTADERRALSLAGSHVLREVEQARTAVNEKDKGKTEEHIQKSLTLVKMIESAMPTQTIHTEIKAGEMTYQDERAVRRLEVPIFSQAAQVSLFRPIEVAQREAAGEEEPVPVVRDAKFRYTRMALHADIAKSHLEAAQEALNGDNWEKADASLAAIQNGVVLEWTEQDLPFVSARDNLTLAKESLEQDRIDQAKVALQAAADNLEAYVGAFAQGEQREERQKVTEGIRSLALQLDDTEKSETIQRIDGWWNQIEGWLADTTSSRVS